MLLQTSRFERLMFNTPTFGGGTYFKGKMRFCKSLIERSFKDDTNDYNTISKKSK